MEAGHDPLLRLLFMDSGPSTEAVLQARDAIAAQGVAVSENLLRNMLALAAMQPPTKDDELISRHRLSKLARIPDWHVALIMIESGMMEYQHANHVGKLLPTEKGASIAIVVHRQVMFRAKPALDFLKSMKKNKRP